MVCEQTWNPGWPPPQFPSPDPTVQTRPILGVTPGRRNVNEACSDLEVHFSLTYLLYFSFSFLIFSKKKFLAMPHGIQDLNSPARGQIHAPCSGSTEYYTTGASGNFHLLHF